MKSRGCDSENHFISDCPKVKKAVLVNLVMDGSLPLDSGKINAMTVDDISEAFQNLPDEV